MQENEFITITIPREIAQYIACFVEDAATRSAIAKAWMSAPDTAGEITCTIHQAQVAAIFARLANVQEGIASGPNRQLLEIIAPVLQDYPQLDAQLSALRQNNQNSFEQVKTSGLNEINKIVAMLSMN